MLSLARIFPSWAGVGNPTKKTQLKSNKSNKMLGFLLGFLKTPTPNSDLQCWVFLLEICWVFRKNCLIFVGFFAHLLDFCLVQIFVQFHSRASFVYFRYENILSRVNLSVKDAFLEQKTLFRSFFPTKIQQNAKTQQKSNKVEKPNKKPN